MVGTGKNGELSNGLALSFCRFSKGDIHISTLIAVY